MHVTTIASLPLRVRIAHALAQDIGSIGDITTHALALPQRRVRARCVVKAKSGVVSGLVVARQVFRVADPLIDMKCHKNDGDVVQQGDVVATIEGPVRGILKAERVALEFLRRMSGIATTTRGFVEKVKGTGVIILDTRKTLPGYGDLDKQAVRDGGAANHRLNLSNLGLIKNNHIDFLKGDIIQAIHRFRRRYPDMPLEVEVRNQKELVLALISRPDRILLDNMTTAQLLLAVHTRNAHTTNTGNKIPLEASGNITIGRVRAVAKTGVEYISIGALTHSANPLDISLHIAEGST